MDIAQGLVDLLAAYTAIGAAFAIPFLIGGIRRIDSQVEGAGLGLRLIILPGVIAFWPLMLKRWVSGDML